MIKYLENENLEDLIKKGTVLVDFYAEWCGPCKMLSPILETLDCDVVKINVDEHNDLAVKNGVMSIPNVFIYKDGELKEKFVGFKSKEEIEKILKK